MTRVYCCGGAGGNIGKQLRNLDLDVCYIDTSISNLKGVDEKNVYLVDGMDGAGKLRASTYEGFKALSNKVLLKFKPSNEINIVISSLSGGSGSIIAPLLTKELISAGQNVIVVGVNSKNSVIELDNTVKTLKTYKSISDATEKCITMYYVENTKRNEADDSIVSFVNLIDLIVDKTKTEEFDISDISNFLNFNKVTDNTASVTLLEVNANDEVFPNKGTAIVSTILVTTNKATSIKPAIPEYLATCIVTDQAYKNQDMRIDNVLGQIVNVVEELETTIQNLKDSKESNTYKSLEVKSSNSDGVVL